MTTTQQALASEVAKRADFSQIRYSQSWEDPECLRGALSLTSDDSVLSIAAAGDNSFALLAYGAGRVVSVDMSPAQTALVHLKCAAMRALDHEEFIRFIGQTPGQDRSALYVRCRAELPVELREFWDARTEIITAGVMHAGKLESMFRVYRSKVQPLMHSRRHVAAVFEPRTLAEREEFWNTTWNNRRWRTIIRLFFSQRVIGKLGRDPEFFTHVNVDVGKHYAQRAKHAFVDLDPTTNPFLQYIMTNRYHDLSTGHPYLNPEHFEAIRNNLDRLEIHCAELEAHLSSCDPGEFTGCNLSDIFEWMSDEHHERVYRAILAATSKNARIAYWNNLVERERPKSVADCVTINPELSRKLHNADRAFLYRAFHVETVVDPTGGAA